VPYINWAKKSNSPFEKFVFSLFAEFVSVMQEVIQNGHTKTGYILIINKNEKKNK
jgi:hypothetical protein